ncbi:efflux RND transporter permease subunit [Roseibium salinum]|uniref:efflux RND transporter permease subunit n=1 Tax=Roseibium salinum TaxID=1604349 RepID=UPI003607AE8B
MPIIYVSVAYPGVSPEDAERLILRPLETELQSVEGVDELKAVAAQGYASVTVEFTAGFDADQAERDVRQAVDTASAELPEGAEEPVVQEVNVALFPVITVMLSGPLTERALIDVAEGLQTRLERLADVLEVDIGGARTEMLEILVDPTALETYAVPLDQLLATISRNNQLVTAGAIDSGAGKITLEVPGVIEDINDVSAIPVKASGSTVVTLGDVAVVRRSFEDPTGFARLDGEPAVALEVKKRIGANIIETTNEIRNVLEGEQDRMPESVRVTYLQDQSQEVRSTLGDLQNNVVMAVLLVMMVTVVTLGWRNSLLVGLSIPGSFLAGIIVLSWLGYTLNIVVLFSLILVLGMLVDAAVVTTELADRRLAGGYSPREAYRSAAKRMSWPMISATLTTLCVFFPLLFWTGVVGEFMKFLPITVIGILIASLAMGLIFIPVLGSLIGRRKPRQETEEKALSAAESGDLEDLDRVTSVYVSALRSLLAHPVLTLLAVLAFLILTIVAYGTFGRGVEFFPEIEPRFVQVTIKSRDNLSIYEMDERVAQVEEAILGTEGIEHIYSRTIDATSGGGAGQTSADTIGTLQLDLLEWDQRRKASEIMAEVRERTAGITGVRISTTEQEMGPGQGKPIELRLTGSGLPELEEAAARVRQMMADIGGFTDVEDDTPVPGVKWQIRVDREKAARFGADVATLGQAVQLVTQGLKLAEYRPGDVEEAVDIRVRFPADERTLDQLSRLSIPTDRGQIPITNFVEIEPSERTGIINRHNAQRTVTIRSGVVPDALPANKTEDLRQALHSAELPAGVSWRFVGQQEEIDEAGRFLLGAFLTAIALMSVVLVAQLNSIYQALVVMSAIVFSITGVLLGLLVTNRPYGIVMGSLGVISLAGIVVNNNIVLIDSFNEMRAKGFDTFEAALRSGAQRLRPVFLTAINDILGLMPLVLGLNVDLINRQIQRGAPSTQYWIELSTTVAGGLAFATFLTLMLTPCMLLIGHRTSDWVGKRFRNRKKAAAAEAT